MGGGPVARLVPGTCWRLSRAADGVPTAVSVGRRSVTDTTNDMIDRKTKFAASLFFLVALVNPRDFPVNNVPLIYPAFLLFVMQMGSDCVVRGFRRTGYLSLLLVGYQGYLTALRLTLGWPTGLGDLAYIIEPVLILTVAGAVTVRRGGTRAAVWAFVAMIALSTACGEWIYFVGEPIKTVRTTVLSSIGGHLLSGAVVRDTDLVIDTDSRNAGLSSDVFAFSYQLTAALVIVTLALLAWRGKRSLGSGFYSLLGMFAVLIVGVFTNTERATVLSVALGVASAVVIGRATIWRLLNKRNVIVLSVCGLVLAGVATLPAAWAEREALQNRPFFDSVNYTRVYMVLPAVASVLYQPLGAGGMSDHYREVAFERDWTGISEDDGQLDASSPHNHFAAIIMQGGIVGVLSTVLLLGGFLRRTRWIRRAPSAFDALALSAACTASVVHALSHNAGFFGLLPPTLIAFGLLWGETANLKRLRRQRAVANGTAVARSQPIQPGFDVRASPASG